MATCVSKKIECRPIPEIFNGISIFNPNNIEADRIKYQLTHRFKGVFDESYNNRKIKWTSSSMQ